MNLFVRIAIFQLLFHLLNRCSCHFGPKCPPGIDPCSTYVQPPVFDYSFTLRYHGIVKNIVPTGVFVRHTQGLWYQYHSGRKSRQSFTDWEGGNRRQLLTIPAAGGNWIQVNTYSQLSLASFDNEVNSTKNRTE